MSAPPQVPANVLATIATYPESARDAFLTIRAIVLRAAETNPAVGPLTETLKWGEPAYLTEASKSGSTVRLAWKPSSADHIAIFLNCRTTLVETLRTIYPDTFVYQGNRALLVPVARPLPTEALDHCARLAQTYHLKHKRTPARG